jgi:hypothetical protein
MEQLVLTELLTTVLTSSDAKHGRFGGHLILNKSPSELSIYGIKIIKCE